MGDPDSAGSADVAEILRSHAGASLVAGGRAGPFRLRRLDVGSQTSERYQLVWQDRSRAFVKRYSQPDVDVTREADALVALQKVLHGRFAAPGPILALAEQRILVTEWIDGVTLMRQLHWGLLRVNPLAAPRVTALAISAATMLTAMRHVETARLSETTASERYRRDFEHRYALLATMNLEPQALAAIHDAMHTAIALTDRAPLAFQHSDFAPWNLLAGGQRLWVVDLHNATAGHPCYDAAYFRAALDLFYRQRFVSHGRSNRVSAAFVAASRDYGDREWQKAESAFAMAHMAYLAHVVMSAEGSGATLGARSLGLFIRAWYKRELRHYQDL